MATMLNSVIDIAQQRNQRVTDEVNNEINIASKKAENLNNLISTASNGVQAVMENKVNTDLQKHQMNIEVLGESIINDDTISIEDKISEYEKRSEEYFSNATDKKGYIYNAYFKNYKDELALIGKEKLASKFVTKLNEFNTNQFQAFIDNQIASASKGQDIMDIKDLVLYSFDINSNTWLTQAQLDLKEDDYVFVSSKDNPTKASEYFDKVMNNIYKAGKGLYTPEQAKRIVEENAHTIELSIMENQILDSAYRKIYEDGISKDDAIISLSIKDGNWKTTYTGSDMTANEVAEYNNEVKSAVNNAWNNATISEEDKFQDNKIGKQFADAESDGKLTIDEYYDIISRNEIKTKFLTEERVRQLDLIKNTAKRNSLIRATIDYAEEGISNTDIIALTEEYGSEEEVINVINNLSVSTTNLDYETINSKTYQELQSETAQLALLMPCEFTSRNAYEDYELGKYVIDGYDGAEKTGALDTLVETVKTVYAGTPLEKEIASVVQRFDENADMNGDTLNGYDRMKLLCGWLEEKGVQIVSEDGDLVLNSADEFFNWGIQKGKNSLVNKLVEDYDRYNIMNDTDVDFYKALSGMQKELGQEVSYQITDGWRVENSLPTHTYADYVEKLFTEYQDGTGYDLNDIVEMARGDSLMSKKDFDDLVSIKNESDAFKILFENKGMSASISENIDSFSASLYGDNDKQKKSVQKEFLKYYGETTKGKAPESININQVITDFKIYYNDSFNKSVEKDIKAQSTTPQALPSDKNFVSSFEEVDNFWDETSLVAQGNHVAVAEYFNRTETLNKNALVYNNLTDAQRVAISMAEAFSYIDKTEYSMTSERILSMDNKSINEYLERISADVENGKIDTYTYNYVYSLANGIYQTSKTVKTISDLSENGGFGDALKPVTIDTQGRVYFQNGMMANTVKTKNGLTYQLIDKEGNELCADLMSEFDNSKGTEYKNKLNQMVFYAPQPESMNYLIKSIKEKGVVQDSRLSESVLISTSEQTLSQITNSQEFRNHKKIARALGLDFYVEVQINYTVDRDGNVIQYTTIIPIKNGTENVCSFYYDNLPLGQYNSSTESIKLPKKVNYSNPSIHTRDGEVNPDKVNESIARLNIN